MSGHAEVPRFTAEEAAQIARDRFGVRSKATALVSYTDQNYRLDTESGESFVLKIANSGVREDVLNFENEAMHHLIGHGGEGRCPEVVRSRSGATIERIENGQGRQFLARMITFLPGEPLTRVQPRNDELLHAVGRFLGGLDHSLSDFQHPAMHRELEWDLRQAADLEPYAESIADPEKRSVLDRVHALFTTEALPLFPELRYGVIHNDGNDANILFRKHGGGHDFAIVDFGDMIYTATVFEVAVAAAYLLLDWDNPLEPVSHVVSGYHQAHPLMDAELRVLFPAIAMRLYTSVVLSARNREGRSENPYLFLHETRAWNALEKLAKIDHRLAYFTLRNACGLPPVPTTPEVEDYLWHGVEPGPVVEPDPAASPLAVLDLTASGRDTLFATGMVDIGEIGKRVEALGAAMGIGRYDEVRDCYRTDQFIDSASGERRTVHLGIDMFLPPGTPVMAPLDGKIHSFRNNAAALDYGPTIILEHRTDKGVPFFTLYGHLSPDSLTNLRPGAKVRTGDRIGSIGDSSVNGGWEPHLHLQIITRIMGSSGNFPGVCSQSSRAIWLSICPDPNLLLRIPEPRLEPPGLDEGEILELRKRHLPPSLGLAYRTPLHMVRGKGQYLYDREGKAYLDLVNNVCHVGHCHPKVVAEAQRQIAVLNTNTRYLHDHLVTYAARLAAHFPEPLSVCFFVCSGSEANELALRLARTHTNSGELIVVDGAYHGNTETLVGLSTYKCEGPGGKGLAPGATKVAMPDPYRGPYKGTDPQAGRKYAGHVARAVERILARGEKPAAFICEPLLGCGGQIVPPPDYLRTAFEAVRAAGGLCIADEVQVGFGRVGTHFWGFQTQNAVPDIVTLGKPMGNGHPLAAVVTTPEIAASFRNGMEYFNTFGGNPVSCAIGLSVLDVIGEERLQEHALSVGNRLMAGFRGLMGEHELIGDVRGLGLFIGIELVEDRQSLKPAAAEAARVVEGMKDRGILLSVDGPRHNVLKIKPPLVLTESDADRVVDTLGQVLTHLA